MKKFFALALALQLGIAGIGFTGCETEGDLSSPADVTEPAELEEDVDATEEDVDGAATEEEDVEPELEGETEEG